MRASRLIVLVFLISLSGCVLINLPPKVWNPHPPNGSVDVPLDVNLSWSASDPNGDGVVFYLYFGLDPNPPLLVSDLETTSYRVEGLDHGRTYYWRVVAEDSKGAVTRGPVWHFTTRNSPPSTPSDPNPRDGAVDVRRDVVLSWRACTDPEGDPVFYDVYMGTSPGSLEKIAEGLVSNSLSLDHPLENGVTYHWKVVARDDRGGFSEGPIWRFTTLNLPPYQPSNPQPPDGARDVPRSTTLRWSCRDPEGDSLYYDVYLGSDSLQLLGRTYSEEYGVSDLLPQSVYRWKVVAHDGKGGSSESPIWSFTTVRNTPPNTPSSPNPPDSSINQPLNTVLSWSGGDPDGDEVQYNVYFGKGSLSLIGKTSHTSYAVPSLSPSTWYSWRIVAIDEYGSSVSGPVWSFKTTDPPAVPFNPNPANGAVLDPGNVTLRWSSYDPNGDPLRYEVYFGSSYPPPLVSSNLSVSELNVGHLGSGLYYWKVVVEDDKGARVEGPVWSFRVREENHPPSIPHDPNPEDGSVVSPISVELRWSCEDPDGDELEYDLYFGKDPEPDLLVSGLRSSSYHVGDLEHGTRYYWKVVARDGKGGIAVGPVWSFTTEPKLEEISRIHLFDGGTGEALVVGDSYSRIAYVVRYDPGRLYVVDLGNEYSPHVVSSVDLGCRVTGMDYGGYLYVLCSSGLEIFDVSNPNDPVLKSSVELDVSYTEDINVGLERIYISGSDFLVLDRTYPTAPWEVSSLDESGGDIEVSGNRVYMEVYGGFEVLDVSDPHDPRVLVYEYTGGSGDLEISGSSLYMDTGSQISVYDVENLDSIHSMGGYYLGSAVWDLKLYWDYVVACTYDGVYVLNFDDPSNPHLLLLYSDPTGYPVSSDVWSDRIYALYSNGDLVVLDSSALWRMVLSTRF